MANKVNPDKDKVNKVEIKIAPSTEVSKFKELLKELEAVVEVKHMLITDEVSLAMFCDSGYSGNSRLDYRHKKFIKSIIDEAFGCDIPSDLFKQPIKETCLFLLKNRRNNPVKKVQAKFLGIKYLKEIKTNDCFRITYPFSIRDHVDYFSGWVMSKINPLNGPVKMKEDIMNDFNEMKTKVYDKSHKHQWKIKTEEGDSLLFYNLYEVCCWLVARASNYNEDAMTKENW